MKIAIDLTPLYGRKRTGVELYAIDLYKSLLKTKHTIIPIFHGANELDNNPCAIVIANGNRIIVENVRLMQELRKVDADIALFPIFPPPINSYKLRTKIIPTIHDLAFIKYRSTLSLQAQLYLIPKLLLSLNKSDAIITISNTVKMAMSNYTSVPVYNCGENISSDYLNCGNLCNESYLKKWNLKPYNYVISVSTIEPRKNFKYLLKVFRKYLVERDMKMVLVGRKGWGSDKELKQLISEMSEYLVFTEYVDVRSLISLYKYAYAFALLSKDEGFGRTPFEAVACGCKKIILSDIPIFRETFSDSALFLPLNNLVACNDILRSGSFVEVPYNFDIPFDVLDKRLPNFLDTISGQL
jgi:glycosyltransferase involved in cell wall biosynthesis